MVRLDDFQQFECGDLEWQREVSNWIKGRPAGDSVLESMANRNTKVWFYMDGEALVGFGSLGPTKWKFVDNQVLLTCIPMLGVKSGFQKKGYGRQILRDLRSRAEENKAIRPVLGLFVHPQKSNAIRLYESEGFTELDRRNGMIRMVLSL